MSTHFAADQVRFFLKKNDTRQSSSGASDRNKGLEADVLPDGPAARGAATSWLLYLVWVGAAVLALPLVGSGITPLTVVELIDTALIFFAA
jgi:hypothetical protein